jgi:aquaporin Z
VQTATLKIQDTQASGPHQSALLAIKSHWPEYLMEAALLGAFMISACVFGVLLEHPSSPLQRSIDSPVVRRALMGVAMGCTLIAIVYSPWGKRSGAHLNPAVTVTFLMLGKVKIWDAVFYSASQFAGGIAGVLVADFVIGPPLRHAAVNYVVTVPGPAGATMAFWVEILICSVLMAIILVVSNTKRLSRWTGLFAATLLATYITLVAPLSGVSLNPARTLGSAYSAGEWTAIWVYFTAPPIAMILAGQLYRIRAGRDSIFCAKLHHENDKRCIFRCNYGELNGR